MDPHIPGEVLAAGQITGIVLAPRLDLRCDRREVPEIEDLGPVPMASRPGAMASPIGLLKLRKWVLIWPPS